MSSRKSSGAYPCGRGNCVRTARQSGLIPPAVRASDCPTARGMSETRETFGRPLASLRHSVTDRCNMQCRYCMPEDDYVWLPRESILTSEETARLVGVF